MNLPRLGLLLSLLVLALTGCVEVRVITVTPAPPVVVPTSIPTATNIAPTKTLAPTPSRTATARATGTRPPTVLPTATALPDCTIRVSPSLAARWTPALRGQVGCPTEAARDVSWAFEWFEQGEMFWRGDEKRIYILYSDKTWDAFADTWTSSLPEDACPNVIIPSGRIKPYHGFGKVWCEQANVRTKIGNGTANEIGPYIAALQAFEHGMLFADTTTNQTLVLYSNGKWE